MAFTKELPDEILKDCHGPDDLADEHRPLRDRARLKAALTAVKNP